MLSMSAIALLAILSLLLGFNHFTVSVTTALATGISGKINRIRRPRILILMYALSLCAGLLLCAVLVTWLLNRLGTQVQGAVLYGIATMAICTGIAELFELFKNRSNTSLPTWLERHIHARTTKKISPVMAWQLGLWTSISILVVWGVPLLAVWAIAAVSALHLGYASLLVIALFLLPTVVVAGFIAGGTSLAAVIAWKEETKCIMHASIGATSIVAGWLLFLWLGGMAEFLS